MSDNRYKKLVSNAALFAIGNFGSKLISLILVPIYTYYLSTRDYGTVDIVTTTTSMLLPIITLCIYDSVLRFTIDSKEDKEEVFTNGLLLAIFGFIVALFLYPLFLKLNFSNNLVIFTYLILFLQAIQSISSQFVRAIGKIKIFALDGIFTTLVTASANILFLIYLDMGVNGYLLSLVAGTFTSLVYLTLAGKTYNFFKIKKFNRSLITKMLIYSMPLIPNSFMWWLMNASSRYFILNFNGLAANGLFAVANKIPSILSMLNSIFLQAWMLSAIEQFDSDGKNDKSKFYSNVFNYLQKIMFVGTSGLLLILKIVMKSVISEDFYSSWKYVPLLLLGVVFSSFSGFIATNYNAAKQTQGVFKTSFIGGILSIFLNVIFIPRLGINGAGLSIVISFSVTWIIRYFDTKKIIDMHLDFKNIFLNLFIIITQIIVLYLGANIVFEIIIELFLFFILVYLNKQIFSVISKLNK